MQNAKDTFYEVLRGRLATLAPDETVALRGVTRPAVVVDENETQSVAPLPDCFHLSWGELQVDNHGAMPLVAAECVIRYGTAGSAWTGGLDRGRSLSGMDVLLASMVNGWPQRAPKQSFAAMAHGGAATVLSTNVWWSDVRFEKATLSRDRVERVARVQVMSFNEPGEQG